MSKESGGRQTPTAKRLLALMTVEQMPLNKVFAERIGVSPQQLANYLNGFSIPENVAARMKLKIPGFSRDWLYDGEIDKLGFDLRRRIEAYEASAAPPAGKAKTKASGRSSRA